MALAVTASIAAALPDGTTANTQQTSAIALDAIVAPISAPPESPSVASELHSDAFKTAKESEKKKHAKRDDDAASQSLQVEITDPAFWSHLTCTIECLVMEQQCKNTGVSQEVCADRVCRANEEYVSQDKNKAWAEDKTNPNKCDCFCGEYKCPRDGGTAAFCENSGDKMKRQLAGELPVVAPVVGSEHNEAKVVEKRDCASDCEALYDLCDNVSSNFTHDRTL